MVPFACQMKVEKCKDSLEKTVPFSASKNQYCIGEVRLLSIPESLWDFQSAINNRGIL